LEEKKEKKKKKKKKKKGKDGILYKQEANKANKN
jgi:hypothetical protein